MDEVAVKRALAYDKVQRALVGIPEMGADWKVLLVSAKDREDQLSARTEIRVNCKTLFDGGEIDVEQILVAVLEYFDGEEEAGL
jgi:hypothetical protein